MGTLQNANRPTNTIDSEVQQQQGCDKLQPSLQQGSALKRLPGRLFRLSTATHQHEA